MVQCKKCSKSHDGSFGSGQFCSRKCANSRSWSESHKEKIRKTIRQKLNLTPRITITCICGSSFETTQKSKKKFCTKKCANKHKMKRPERRKKILSIYDLSTRTISKILKRIGKGCCVCGWDKSSCDLHHIKGRKIENPNSHDNLTLLCPNCHRLFHDKKILEDDIIPLSRYLGDDWLQFYYG